MPKISYYNCDYCGVSLMHDSMSVRKSHAVGKHHIKYVVDYYENVAKEEGIIPEDAAPASSTPRYTVDPIDQTEELKELSKNVPGLAPRKKPEDVSVEDVSAKSSIPPPASLKGMPPPQLFYSSR